MHMDKFHINLEMKQTKHIENFPTPSESKDIILLEFQLIHNLDWIFNDLGWFRILGKTIIGHHSTVHKTLLMVELWSSLKFLPNIYQIHVWKESVCYTSVTVKEWGENPTWGWVWRCGRIFFVAQFWLSDDT